MRIRRLKLAGFKSFVDPVELTINPGLTGVVGPNGCGKSNLLEAIRWTMGEGSPKSLRGGAMEDVIFSGTVQRPARDFAEVSLLIERPADDGEPEELEVVRRIERGAGSAYRLNGRDVRARDVALLFADAATGAHSPALVSQNRIGAVIAARPAERRQMLEEAAGIAGLHVRRRDAEAKLRQTEANLERLDTIIGDMAARAAALRRQARTAERYRALTDAARLAEARTLWARWRDADRAAGRARDEARRAEAETADAAERQRGAAAHATAAAGALERARMAAEAARGAAGEAAHALAALTGEREAVARRIAQLDQAAEALAAEGERDATLAGDATEAIAALGAEEAALVARLAKAEAASFAAAEALGAAATVLGEAEQALAGALGAQAAAGAERRVAEAAVQAAANRLAAIAGRVDRAAQERAALDEEAPLAVSRGRAEAERRAAMTVGETAAADAARGEAARAAVAAERDGAAAALAGARARLAALEAEAAALAPPRQSGRPGVLTELRAAPGYERALTAALGDELSLPLGSDGWSGAAPAAGDPALPPGAEPLADHVRAPAALARRLAQVGVVAADDGAPLAAGQRLVTRAGRVRRWDGLVTEGVGAAAAERLVRVNRLAAIEGELPAARAAAERVAATRDAADRAARQAERDLADARARAAVANEEARRAALEVDRLGLAMERLAARRDEHDRTLAALEAERAEAAAARDAAAETSAALPDMAGLDAAAAELSTTAAAARGAAADRRAEAALRSTALAADRERLERVCAERAGWGRRAEAAAGRALDVAARAGKVAAEQMALAGRPAALAAQIDGAQSEEAAARAAAAAAGEASVLAQAAAAAAERSAADAAETLAAAREARAGAAARAEAEAARRGEISAQAGERFQCPAVALPERLGFVSGEVGAAPDEQAALDRALAERERLGPVNLVAAQELAELEAGGGGLAAEREELGQAVARLRGSIGSLNREGRARLLEAFEAVNGHFGRLFATLFEGGQAHLALIDSDDPLEAGLEIMAQPPGKKLAALTLLSGGEQALTAVALIFGLFLTNPAPLCVLDEVDAPLDDANIERFCDLLDRMTAETDTRYLIVTHNAVTMARMHRLFGVTMVEHGVSRLVSVDLGGAERLLAAE